eukprot:519568-Hanusia_phi.AAC.3
MNPARSARSARALRRTPGTRCGSAAVVRGEGWAAPAGPEQPKEGGVRAEEHVPAGSVGLVEDVEEVVLLFPLQHPADVGGEDEGQVGEERIILDRREGNNDVEQLVLPARGRGEVQAGAGAGEDATSLVPVRLGGGGAPEELGEVDGAAAGDEVGPRGARTSGDCPCCHAVGELDDVDPAVARAIEHAEEDLGAGEVAGGVRGGVADHLGEFLKGEEGVVVEIDLSCLVRVQGQGGGGGGGGGDGEEGEVDDEDDDKVDGDDDGDGEGGGYDLVRDERRMERDETRKLG